MACIVIPSSYTAGEDFTDAARVVGELGDPPGVQLTLAHPRAAVASGPKMEHGAS